MAPVVPTLTAPTERDLRLDLFRGLALWLIFLDHIPTNIVTWITIRNYGFSDATEIFIFISGYTAAFVYGRAMRERGFMVASARILQARLADLRRPRLPVRDLHGGDRLCRASFDNPLYAEEMNALDFLKQPDVTLIQALLLKFKPVNMDVLPLYIVLLLAVPADALAAACARRRSRSRSRSRSTCWPGIRAGTCRPIRAAHWYFNPFAWQLMFVFGAWCALGGAARLGRCCARAVARGLRSPICCSRSWRQLTWYFPALRGPASRIGFRTGCIRSTRPIWTCCASRISWRSPSSRCGSFRATGRR